MKETTDHTNDIIVVAILAVIAFVFLPFGLLADLVFIPPIIGLYALYKKDIRFFVGGLFIIIWSIFVADFTTGFLDLSWGDYKYYALGFVKDFLDPFFSQKKLYQILNLESKAFDIMPLTALILPSYLIYRFKLWNKLTLFQKNKKHSFSQRKINRLSEKSDQLMIGIDKNSKKPVCLSDQQRLRHTHVIGATGFGKTESVLLPMIEDDIKRGNGLLLLDAKGDENLLRAIHKCAMKHNRAKDILFFNPSFPSHSYNYNPLDGFDSTMVMNKIIGSLEWTEPYYKKMSQLAILTLVNAMQSCQRTVNMKTLYEALINPHELLKEKFDDDSIKDKLKFFCQRYRSQKDAYIGLIADLDNFNSSGFGLLMNGNKEQIKLTMAYSENKIVIFQVSTLNYPETARAFGKILLRDIAQMCGLIVCKLPDYHRRFFPVYIDEFGSFAYPEFAEVMRMSRASGVALTILHQSLGDLDIVDPSFKQQIQSNSNIKVVLKVNDNDTVDEVAKMSGTKNTLVHTYQVNDRILNSKERTGLGTETLAREFNIHPELIRNLQLGEAIVSICGENKQCHVQLQHCRTPVDYTDLRLLLQKPKKRQPTAKKSDAKPKVINHDKRLSQTLFGVQ